MSLHTEYTWKRSAFSKDSASPSFGEDIWDRNDSFLSYYVRKEDFSGITPKQVPQPEGKIYFKLPEKLQRG